MAVRYSTLEGCILPVRAIPQMLGHGHPSSVELSFELKLPVEFRRVGARRWLMGYTEDMGSCGVRFRAGEWVSPNSRIEMVFRMPVGDPCNLVCTGTVMRVDLPAHAGLLPTIAATIDDYKFVRL